MTLIKSLLALLSILFYCSLEAKLVSNSKNIYGEPYCDVVIANKKIEIPGFPQAHNPSMIQTEHGILLTFRNCPRPKELWISQLGVVFLDENFNPISKPQLINTRPFGYSTIESQSEDARIFSSNGRLYLIYNDNIEVTCPTVSGRRDMFVSELTYEDGQFTIGLPIKIIHTKKYASTLWQKNWIPFDYNNSILISYMVNPHEVLTPNFETGDCSVLCESSFNTSWWHWGKIRGGTPAVLVDGEYLAFFHSGHESKSIFSNGRKMWHYFMGAYTFKPHPPFEITKMSLYPIIGENFYTRSSFPKRVVFPGGFFVSGNNIHIAMGKDDSEVWITTIDKTALNHCYLNIRN